MKLKETLTIVIITFGATEIAQATSAIHFVNRDSNTITYRSVPCIETPRVGQSITVEGQQRNKDSSVNLKTCRLGTEGEHKIRNEVYQFEAVKFKEREFGSKAPQNDINPLAYSCFDPIQLIYREEVFLKKNPTHAKNKSVG